MMTLEQRKRLSKFLSLVLRHEPHRLALRLDDEGSVLLADLLAAIRQKRGWEQQVTGGARNFARWRPIRSGYPRSG